ncbi:MAG: hypothetical protein ABI054_00220 [Planctomycetota bacterium]
MPWNAMQAVHLPLAGFSGAKMLLLGMIIALPAILIIGTLLKRSRSR